MPLSKNYLDIISQIISAGIIVCARFVRLILYPYKTMRSVSKEKDWMQVVLIIASVMIYFSLAHIFKLNTFSPNILVVSLSQSIALFFITFFSSIGFFYLAGVILKQDVDFKSLVFTFTYSLYPSIVWFVTTMFLYKIFPPPRTFSTQGLSLSMTFLVFSISLLIWRAILLYLSLRFSLKANFYVIAGVIMVFLLWFIPYIQLLQKYNVLQIPFL